jgi:hypothetical protein
MTSTATATRPGFFNIVETPESLASSAARWAKLEADLSKLGADYRRDNPARIAPTARPVFLSLEDSGTAWPNAELYVELAAIKALYRDAA